MAEIGEDRFSNDDEERKHRKFTVVDKRGLADEEASSHPSPPPSPAAKPEPKEAKTIHVGLPEQKAPAAAAATAPAIAAATAPPKPAEETEEAEAIPPGVDADPLSISNALLFFVEELFTRILIYLGLTPNPQTGLTIRKMDQAQRGIQVLELLIREARKDAPQEIDVYLDRLLQQVKLAYVQIVTGNTAGLGGRSAGPMG